MSSFISELSSYKVIVCCGPGGVGKTTVSAALATHFALEGRRVCVLTLDPARRLADALGIATVGNVPVHVAGIEPGSLHAVMLDAKGTFDDLVDLYAQSPEQAVSIKSNRLYQSLASSLSGTQEYMAMEKLYELTRSDRFDLVIVDTPPTRNALDLLDAPQRMTSFLENKVFRALLTPTRAYLKVLSVATRALVATIGKVAGAELLEDAIGFFQAFAGMEQGFAQRAGEIQATLRSPETAFVLITSPRHDAVSEAQFFAERLSETGLAPAGVVANRVHPLFLSDDLPEAVASSSGDLGELVANAVALSQVAENEGAVLEILTTAVAPAPVLSLPLSGSAVNDVEGLTLLSQQFS